MVAAVSRRALVLGGLTTLCATSDALRSGLPVFSIHDEGGDFGACGDGMERKLSRSLVRSKRQLGFSGQNRLDDFDEEDTEDWLAITMAVRRASEAGGGIVTGFAGHYVTRRFIVVPSNVRLRGDPMSRPLIENRCDLTGGWLDSERRSVFQLLTSKLQAFLPDDSRAASQTELHPSFPVDRTTSVIPIANPRIIRPGSRVVVFDKRSYPAGATRCPFHLSYREILDLTSGEALLDQPVGFECPAGYSKIALMGTGSDPSYGGAPYDFVSDVEIAGFRARGSTLLGYAVAGRRVRICDIDLVCDRARRVYNNTGLQINGGDSWIVERLEVNSTGRQLEVKGGTSQSAIKHYRAKQLLACTPPKVPLVSVGESSRAIELAGIALEESITGSAVKIHIGEVEDLSLLNVSVTARSSGGTGATIININGHPDSTTVTAVTARHVVVRERCHCLRYLIRATAATASTAILSVRDSEVQLLSIASSMEKLVAVKGIDAVQVEFNLSTLAATAPSAEPTLAPVSYVQVPVVTLGDLASKVHWINTVWKASLLPARVQSRSSYKGEAAAEWSTEWVPGGPNPEDPWSGQHGSTVRPF